MTTFTLKLVYSFSIFRSYPLNKAATIANLYDLRQSDWRQIQVFWVGI